MTVEKPSPKRWIILIAYMLLTLAVEGQWLALAPVARPAERFYQSQIASGSLFGVDFLTMIYLLTYLVMSIPASRYLDRAGLRRGITLGALLGSAGAILKAGGAGNYWVVLAGQTLLGIAQPFILNAATTLAARWFPMGERALAVGLGTLAQFLGFVLAMVLGPALVVGNPALASYGSGVELLLKVHCGFTLASAAFCIMFLADRGTAGEAAALAPPTPIRVLFRSPDFRLMLGIFAAGLGILNALSGMEDAVAAHVGAVTSDGMLGASLIGGGIVGAIALPALSDFLHKRRPFLILCMCGMIPGVAGVAGMAWAGKVGADPGTAYLLAKVASGVLGFFLLGGGSIGFQYAAEVTHPAPEATSQGLLLLAGQVTGIIFMVAMGRPALLGPVLVGFTTLAALCGASSYFLKESPLVGQRP